MEMLVILIIFISSCSFSLFIVISDEEFRKSFFIIYKCFTNAVELLNEVKRKLVANWEHSDFVNRYCININ